MSLAIPKDSVVLVTGATGYIGSWIAHEFVKQGYRVRAAARNQEKATLLKSVLEKQYGSNRVEIALISDMTDPHAYDEAIKGVSAVVHVASDVSFSTDAETVIGNVVASTQNVLRLAAKEPTIKRFVLTSSSVSVSLPVFDQDITYGPNVWNDKVVEKVRNAASSESNTPFDVYAASKTVGERSLWEFVEKEKPSFVVNTVLPDFTIGPALHKDLAGSTHNWLRGLYNGEEASTQLLMGELSQHWWVNVEDIARLHVGGTILEDVKGKRLLGYAQKYAVNQFLDTMHEMDPGRKLPEKIQLKDDRSKVDARESLLVLKGLGRDGWTGYDETLKANLGY
ncbi:hypothetical protein HIM_08121 [Hirsutella minnesotensis 3608]|uniref:NAD-dependent epimerase/dehydratase domain-containing protein n=1 Tax=Hirsutella minnesotensis 3608 TaxID=1043627 RepID=A0A0F7ZYG9_9HYPO|nr:hypothetical protein HIM_08121 [Hirsutella minnesotensis 3608]